MTIYSGTVLGKATLTGGGVTVRISTKDVVTADLSINPDGTFSGMEEQDVTVTIPGHSPVTQHFPGVSISGNANVPTNLLETIGGQQVHVAANFANGDQTINIDGGANINYNYNGVDYSGTLSALGTLQAQNISFTISGAHTAHEPTKLVGGQLIASEVYTVSMHGDKNPNHVYAVTIANSTLQHGIDGANQGLSYQAFGPIHLNVTPSHAQQFTIAVLNDQGADDVNRHQSNNDGSVFWTATATGPLGGNIPEAANSIDSVQILESPLTHHFMPVHLHTSDVLLH